MSNWLRALRDRLTDIIDCVLDGILAALLPFDLEDLDTE